MGASTNYRTVTCRYLNELAATGTIDLVDVRTPAEFRELHCSYSRNVPLDSLEPRAIMAGREDAGTPVYVICQSGNRSSKACERFVAAGFTNVVNVDGGTVAWAEAGLSVVRGQKTMSLERQVRVAAGFLVFVGSTIGFFQSGSWIGLAGIGLSGFVGAGLMFAGITDTCAMGMLIARMPWNRVSPATNSDTAMTADSSGSTVG